MSKMLVSVVFLAAFGYAQAAEKPSLTVTTPNDVVNPDDNLISLREAFKYAENDTPGIPGALGGQRLPHHLRPHGDWRHFRHNRLVDER